MNKVRVHIVSLSMANYNDDTFLFDEIFSDLTYSPNKHLVHARINDYLGVSDYEGYFFERNRDGISLPFLEVNGKKIEKFHLTCSLGFYDSTGKQLDYQIQDFSIDLYIVLKNPEYVEDHTIMGIDELALYITMQRNDEVKGLLDFPTLTPCQLPQMEFNYINEGRRILNTYFPNLKGPAMHLYFENELNEVFAVTSNSLAFLYRYRNRAIEEITIIGNNHFNPQFHVYPRFNNCISETAGYLYSFWERIAFVLNEFFPINNSNRVPSFYQYFTKQKEKNDTSLKSKTFDWFANRLDNEHKTLGEMRHPMIHYNKFGSPSGMRSADLIEQLHNGLDKTELCKTWSDELDFLKSELANLSDGLKNMLLLVEEWAIAKKEQP